MAFEHEPIRRLAVLIDGDNVSPRVANSLFREIGAMGEASVRRIYGDFSASRLKGWTEVLSLHAIVPQQNFFNVSGKNASDIALVIDAMDLLHTSRFDAFCLVSSDSDFTRLAMRIREQGVDVYGFGERKTPDSFRKACRKFTYVEELVDLPAPVPFSKESPVSEPTPVANVQIGSIVPLIHAALRQLDDMDSWYFLGAVGNRLVALSPGFDTRAYGFPKLLPLLRQCGAFDVRHDALKVYIRPKTGSCRLQRAAQ